VQCYWHDCHWGDKGGTQKSCLPETGHNYSHTQPLGI
jgi:hypothetical protein